MASVGTQRVPDARLDIQIADQVGIVSSQRLVGRMMQLDTMRNPRTPAVSADGVEDRGKLAAGFDKLLGLSR